MIQYMTVYEMICTTTVVVRDGAREESECGKRTEPRLPRFGSLSLGINATESKNTSVQKRSYPKIIKSEIILKA